MFSPKLMLSPKEIPEALGKIFTQSVKVSENHGESSTNRDAYNLPKLQYPSMEAASTTVVFCASPLPTDHGHRSSSACQLPWDNISVQHPAPPLSPPALGALSNNLCFDQYI